MVVDDLMTSRRFVTASLKASGHEVQEIEPACLFSVLQVLHAAPPDLLICDLVMPNCPGQTVIRACREDPHLKGIKILLLTAHGDADLGHFLQKMGNTHYLTKPVSQSELAGCVEMFLNGDLELDPGWDLACKGLVAVIDDSRMSRVFHAACLRKAGFRPVEIEPTDLLGTLEAVEAAQPELLVLDFVMPNFRGDALIRAMRSRDTLKDIPVLLVTAHHGDVKALTDAIGGVELMFKPIQAETLVARVHALIG